MIIVIIAAAATQVRCYVDHSLAAFQSGIPRYVEPIILKRLQRLAG